MTDPAREMMIEKMVLIRTCEEAILDLFSQGAVSGTTHVSIGQEAGAVGVVANLAPTDIIVSNHRCHGHYLAFTDDVEGLLGEVMGRESGLCAGLGGSQHLCGRNFYSNGVQGGMVPCAVGMALAEKRNRTGAVAAVFVGDGTFGQGVLYEALNLASLWSVPLLMVVENNRYAQSTPIERNFAGSFLGRAAAFGIDAAECDATDVETVAEAGRAAVESVRTKVRPFMLVLHTYRLCPHSKGDDFRPAEEIAEWKSRDPLLAARAQVGETAYAAIEHRCRQRIENAIARAAASPISDWQPAPDAEAQP